MIGSAENFFCPYCGAANMLIVDSPASQSFVQDCEVCCKPIIVRVTCRGGEIVEIRVQQENE